MPDPSGGFQWWGGLGFRHERKLLTAKLEFVEANLKLLEREVEILRTLVDQGPGPVRQDEDSIP